MVDYKSLIKEYRHNNFLTQQDFAKKLGVSVKSIIRWEKGTFKPTMKVRKKIAELCDASKIDMEKKYE